MTFVGNSTAGRGAPPWGGAAACADQSSPFYLPPGAVVYPDHFRYLGLASPPRTASPSQSSHSAPNGPTPLCPMGSPCFVSDHFQQIMRRLLSEGASMEVVFNRYRLRQQIICLMLREKSLQNNTSVNNLWGAYRRRYNVDRVDETLYGVAQLTDVLKLFEDFLGVDGKNVFFRAAQYPDPSLFKKETCVQFSDPEGCAYGDDCLFSHVPDARPPCIFHHISRVGCKYGDRCLFAHDELPRKRHTPFDVDDRLSRPKLVRADPDVGITMLKTPSGGGTLGDNRVENVYRQLEDVRELFVHYRLYGGPLGERIDGAVRLFDTVVSDYGIPYEVAQRGGVARRGDYQCDLTLLQSNCLICSAVGFSSLESVENGKRAAINVLTCAYLSVAPIPSTVHVQLKGKCDLMIDAFDRPPTHQCHVSPGLFSVIPEQFALIFDNDPRLVRTQTCRIFETLYRSSKLWGLKSASRSSVKSIAIDESSPTYNVTSEFLLADCVVCAVTCTNSYQSQSWMAHLALEVLQQHSWSVLLYDKQSASDWKDINCEELADMLTSCSHDRITSRGGLTFVPPGRLFADAPLSNESGP